MSLARPEIRTPGIKELWATDIGEYHPPARYDGNLQSEEDAKKRKQDRKGKKREKKKKKRKRSSLHQNHGFIYPGGMIVSRPAWIWVVDGGKVSVSSCCLLYHYHFILHLVSSFGRLAIYVSCLWALVI